MDGNPPLSTLQLSASSDGGVVYWSRRMDSKAASHEDNVACGFLLHCRWSWQLVNREGLPIGLILRSKGGNSCNVLGSTNIVGQNVSCRASP